MAAFSGLNVADVLQHAMRVSAMDHRIIANNIANVDTPRFTPTELDFQATLRSAIGGQGRVALRKTQVRHLEAGHERAVLERLAVFSKNDYNKVDLEHEMARLGENTGRYTTYGSLLTKHFKQVKDLLTNIR